MDQRLKEAIEYSNYRLTLATHKKNIRLRAEAIQLVSDSGGMFRASEQLILWLDYLIRNGTDQYVLNDSNDQPILVKDIPSLHKKLADGHAKAMNLLHAENEKIKRARTIAKVADIPQEVEKTETINDQSESSSTAA